MSFNQQEGNLDADRFANLYSRYRSRLLNSMTGIVRDRVVAEDITAAAFATAFEKRSEFRGDALAYNLALPDRGKQSVRIAPPESPHLA